MVLRFVSCPLSQVNIYPFSNIAVRPSTCGYSVIQVFTSGVVLMAVLAKFYTVVARCLRIIRGVVL